MKNLKTNLILQKIKSYFPSILLAVVIATAFFIHESFETMPEKYNQAKANLQNVKAENTDALNSVKQLHSKLYSGEISLEEFGSLQSKLYEDYIKINGKQKELHEIAAEAKIEVEFKTFAF